MAEQRPQRRLAAILAADVVGYSRLMEADEAGTLARLRAVRTELFAPATAAHGGRIFKTTGDGALVEFASAVGAVESAVEIQRALSQREADQPEDKRIALRIGISLGDVIVEGADLYGNGVNVAARLEAMAEPGGICVSGNVHDSVGTSVDIGYEDLGERQVKNIERPVRAWRVRLDDAEPRQAVKTAAPALPDKPSIAVLPFANLSSDPEQAYFSDGISEDVITDLSKIAGLFVIARNSTFVYRGADVDIQKVGRELGVRFVLEGSVRKAGSRVRVTAQLIEAATRGHVWAERYDRDIDDIFAVQDELTREIVSALAPRLTADERARLSDRGTANFEAYDLFLRGRELVWLHTKVEGQSGQELLRRAIDLDPGFGKAYALLSFAHAHEFVNGWAADPDAALAEARALAERAVALAPHDAECHWALGVALQWSGDLDGSLEQGRKILELEPNSSLGLAHLGLALMYSGQPEAAIETLAAGMRLDPHYPDTYLHFLAQAYFNLEQFDRAEEILRERIARNPNSEMTRVLLASVCGHLGRPDEARAEWREAMRINPGYSIEQRRNVLPFKNPADLDRMIDGLRMAGLPG